MGQFGNQPDFATTNIQEITPNDTISNQYFLTVQLYILEITRQLVLI